MTKREALQILMDNAARNLAGVGRGIRPSISNEQKMKVIEAIIKIHPDAYGFPADNSYFYNRGL